MSPNPGIARWHDTVHPLLVECNATGQVLWMSRRAREVLGEIRYITDLLPFRQPSPSAEEELPPVQLWKVWESGKSVILEIRPAHPPGSLITGFAHLERRLAQKFFHLLRHQKLLSERLRNRKRSGAGSTAIRLIEQERQRLGRELHTGVGQTLAAIRLQTDVISTDLPDPPPRVRRALENIATLAWGALEQVRSVSQQLHPPEWQRLPLTVALQQLWDLSAIPEHFQGQLQFSSMPVEPSPEVKALIYRAMQEALSNLLRHSKATRVDATLETEGDRVILSVTDNGVGFDAAGLYASPVRVSAGIGIRSIREQVEGIGGKFDIESGITGTKLVISVLLAPSE